MNKKEKLAMFLIIIAFGLFPGYLIMSTAFIFHKIPMWYAIINVIIGFLDWCIIMLVAYMNKK